jgi:hypothetical protein
MPRQLWKCVHCGKEFATEAGCEAHEKDCKATLRDTVEDLKSRVRRLERALFERLSGTLEWYPLQYPPPSERPTVVMYGVWTDDSTFANDGNTYTTRTSINIDEG